ncbi:DUF459 domain-containing protein [Acinetobacter qingfengensis]|uniref:Uncharacterized protein n=1 Tax=Acinetobacter qingfengensis TaxID=1262585 RepID=A0A1E7RDU2_9GAMM|nr:DUF459 domain-containing protein [Acinetobacter qingfengensis]KAA8733683.1 DUF459 domain-containing protein [Acinetobacter qingfengensis]OEY97501.1 hypothetical protein BJI46_09740 [Acinetobacter qingfengensis]
MPISNQPNILGSQLEIKQIQAKPQPKSSHFYDFVYVFIILLSFAVMGIWIMQNSVNAYVQQTYHRDSPLLYLNRFAWWQLGEQIGTTLYQADDHAKVGIAQVNARFVENFNAQYAYTPEYKKYLVEKNRQEQIRLAQEAQTKALLALQNQFALGKNDQVFFAGDSMMQGVAPWVQKYLQENFAIKTVNLSKQSTGLTYPSFFDWPKTIRDTLNSNANIKVMVIFLGPNDPWDISNPQGGAALKFQSPEWETEYRARISGILQDAQKHHVSVMWVGPPNMRKDLLNTQMTYLTQVIADEVKKHQAYYIDSRLIVGDKHNIYSDYLIQGNNSIKMRSADGIHFSPDGQKTIAQVIERHFKILN